MRRSLWKDEKKKEEDEEDKKKAHKFPLMSMYSNCYSDESHIKLQPVILRNQENPFRELKKSSHFPSYEGFRFLFALLSFLFSKMLLVFNMRIHIGIWLR